ncbi:MAG: hypothetical protein K8R02_06970 [Anaerohalosphaeraceae bacterium]|nr:hypothetical protein [Anaerohalosphaeraceae bacterium]
MVAEDDIKKVVITYTVDFYDYAGNEIDTGTVSVTLTTECPEEPGDTWGLKVNCGLSVRCGKLEENDLIAKWLNKLGFRHCDIGKGRSGRNDGANYDITIDRSSSRTVQNGKAIGTSCKCAKCNDIEDCVAKEYIQGMKNYSAYGNNCHTFTAKGLSKCCMKSNWRPAFHAGPDPTCTKWEMKIVRIEPWGPIYELVCVEHSPAY